MLLRTKNLIFFYPNNIYIIIDNKTLPFEADPHSHSREVFTVVSQWEKNPITTDYKRRLQIIFP